MAMRINYPVVGGEPLKIMLSMEGYLQRCGLEKPLLELVKMRASQINGCAYCLDMHSKDARAAGETEQRLYLLNAWREAPFYNDRERAALEWTETLTLISQQHVTDAIYDRVRSHFSENELVDLTYAVMAINAWNRLAISMKSEPGHYKPLAR
jgi:AhpD family alkylhydroperoxidase